MSAEPEDLLGKADALMARHRPAPSPGALRTEIPVLEEVVDYVPGSGDLPLLTELVEPAPLDEEQAEALAASIRAQLLAELRPRIDALIEQRLRDELAPLIENMFDDLRGKLLLTAREILDDAIHSALEQELERRRTAAGSINPL